MDDGDPVIIDSLAFGPLFPLIREHAKKHPVIAIMHLPLSINPDLSHGEQTRLAKEEKKAMDHAHRIIVTSHYAAREILSTGAGVSKIRVIMPGVDTETVSRKRVYPEIPEKFLCVGSYLPNKGHKILLKALSLIPEKSWKLDCYGEMPQPVYFKELTKLVNDFSLDRKVSLHGPATGRALNEAYLLADVLIHPSSFETYGMVPAEALAHGLPVLTSTGGALRETVPDSMGRFFDPGNENGLYQIITRLTDDKSDYKKLCRNAAKYYLQANKWKKSIDEFESMLNTLLSGKAP